MKKRMLSIISGKTSMNLSMNRNRKPHECILHYENTPIQIYWKFHNHKTESFQIKILLDFQISAKNIDCGYSLELPRRGGSNEYPQSMF